MKSKTDRSLLDLNNILFDQLERLGSKDLKGEELSVEINRAAAICGVANQIRNNASLVLHAAKASDKFPSVERQTLLLGRDALTYHE